MEEVGIEKEILGLHIVVENHATEVYLKVHLVVFL
jgi:hypothetical protein